MPKQNSFSPYYKHQGPELFQKSKRLVIKVGSALLVDQNGHLSTRSVTRIVNLVLALKKAGKEVILVSSGAVVASQVLRTQVKLNLVRNRNKTSATTPTTLTHRQAYSAIGQVYLMEKYRRAFMSRGCLVGQVLISKFAINHRPSYLNARNTIHELLAQGVIPIINENDALATEEFRFGENDILGALIAGLIDAELYVIFSKIHGVYQGTKKTSAVPYARNGDRGVKKNLPPPQVYSILCDLSEEFMKQFKTTTSASGSGGIIAKLEAGRLANQLGVPTLIKNGEGKDLFATLHDTGGTLIFANTVVDVSARKRWLLSQVTPKGKVIIDDGAVEAIQKGKSLLPGGIVTVQGNIGEGDICNLVNQAHQVIARGMSNYSTQELNLIKGKRTAELEKILGKVSHSEVIHRDNLALWN